MLAPKEVFEWVKTGEKTIDIRKGKPVGGNIAVFECGPNYLKLKITRVETGRLAALVKQDNYRLIVPSAKSLDDAMEYFHQLYGSDDILCTAYYLEKPENSQ